MLKPISDIAIFTKNVQKFFTCGTTGYC